MFPTNGKAAISCGFPGCVRPVVAEKFYLKSVIDELSDRP